MRRSLAALVAGVVASSAAVPLLVLSAGPTQAASSAQLSVFHGVPGLTVDVYLDNKKAIDNFKPGMMAGPLAVPAGKHVIAITAADAADDSKPAIGPVTVTLASGVNYTAVAHLTASGKPTASLFTNDTSSIAAGKGRLTVRHTAAAPAVDVLLGGKAVAGFTNLTNPNEAKADLPAGTLKDVAVAAAGTTAPAIGPTDLTVAAGTNTIVYAWGSLADKNLNVAVQTVNGLGSSPTGAGAGDAGLVAPHHESVSSLGLVALLVAVLGVGFFGRRLRLGRR
jgi:hypothetical protein